MQDSPNQFCFLSLTMDTIRDRVRSNGRDTLTKAGIGTAVDHPSHRLGCTMRVIAASLVLLLCTRAGAQELLLIAQDTGRTFLGCLNCSKYDSASVCNKYGDQGSKYSLNSIWNKYSDPGSKFSDYSPWNKYANKPPAIVDREGKFYGYFTSNKYVGKRTEIQAFVVLTDEVDWVNEDLDRARDAFCER